MNPYSSLPPEAFWRTAIAAKNPHQIDHLWKPKKLLQKTHRIVTAGSCFAQHIGRALKAHGYKWVDAEPAPALMPESVKKSYNYGVFSFRTGNIYTAALLRQRVGWAFGEIPVPNELWIDAEGRYFDPFRPNIEPGGFASEAEFLSSREATLKAIRTTLTGTDLFVFTLGLTEAWENREHNYVYSMCPGTVAGTFSDKDHAFRNFQYHEIRQALRATFDWLKEVNPHIRFLLTVSPVPLTATAADQHVLVATSYSKSTLRAVAGDMAANRKDTDYFPSYEIISSFPFRAMFFEPNMRSVAPEGVQFVMKSFFDAQTRLAQKTGATTEAGQPNTSRPSKAIQKSEGDVVCEDVLLDAFGGNP